MSINGTVSLETDITSLESKFTEKWGFDLKELYKVALRFYKEKEGKAVHISYQEKCELVAYTQQVSHGPYDPVVHGDVGVLDVVGRDRKLAWQKLGSLSRDAAMAAFVQKIDTLCPQFHPYVEALKQDAETRARRAREEEEQRKIEEARRKEEEEERLRQEAEQEEKRKLIKEALNQQTYSQFKSYAEQQYPDNPDHQAVLIRQLQDQHYIQYMQQIYHQQIVENTEITGDASKKDLPVDVEAVALNALSESLSTAQNEEQYSDSDGEQEDMPEVAPASMWTRKDIKEFKDSIKKEGKESIIKVGHGETVTVRVPTHEDGSCLFWEFATDSYDIGFGLFFEWTKSPTQQVSVHISDSEDEDEDEDEAVEVTEEDIEQGGSLLRGRDADRPPLSVIIPVYRRDCQEEVYAGSHVYPGQGVYLLKFDNSYSLWRSKTLYYRVYYTR